MPSSMHFVVYESLCKNKKEAEFELACIRQFNGFITANIFPYWIKDGQHWLIAYFFQGSDIYEIFRENCSFRREYVSMVYKNLPKVMEDILSIP